MRVWLLGIFGFLVAIAFCPWLEGSAASPRWAILAIGPWLLLDDTAPRLSRNLVLLLAFIAWCAITLVWSPSRYDGVGELCQLFIALGVFLLGERVENPRTFYAGFAIGIFAAALFGVFGPDLDLLGEAAAVALIACICAEAYGIALLMAYPLWLSGSRAAVVALLVVTTMALYKHSRRVGIAVGLCGCLIVLLLVMLGSYAANAERFSTWIDTLNGLSFQGNGLGSFYDTFAHWASRLDILQGRRPEHAHNDLLEIVFETGIIGGVFALGIAAAAVSSLSVERYVIICVFVCAFFGFSLHMPATLGMAAFAFGRISRGDRVFDRIVAGRSKQHLSV